MERDSVASVSYIMLAFDTYVREHSRFVDSNRNKLSIENSGDMSKFFSYGVCQQNSRKLIEYLLYIIQCITIRHIKALTISPIYPD